MTLYAPFLELTPNDPYLEPPPATLVEEYNLFKESEEDTLVYQPLKDHHCTFIMLHGRGSSAKSLAADLLSSTTAQNETLHEAFPHAKFLFPNAPARHPSIFNATKSSEPQGESSNAIIALDTVQSRADQPTSSDPIAVRQWFDNWFLPDYGHPERDHLAITGLYASCLHIHKLLDHEIQLVGSKKVVLWGVRQGAAVALSTLLTWEGQPFAAAVGMSDWLPFDDFVWKYANGDDFDQHTDEWFNPDTYWPKEHEDDEDFNWPTKALKCLRFELYLQLKKGEAFKKIPVFMGQSKKDKINDLGKRSKKWLDILGTEVQMAEYESSSPVHGYSQEMLAETFDFIRPKIENSKG